MKFNVKQKLIHFLNLIIFKKIAVTISCNNYLHSFNYNNKFLRNILNEKKKNINFNKLTLYNI